jgi:hypothetical protein
MVKHNKKANDNNLNKKKILYTIKNKRGRTVHNPSHHMRPRIHAPLHFPAQRETDKTQRNYGTTTEHLLERAKDLLQGAGRMVI